MRKAKIRFAIYAVLVLLVANLFISFFPGTIPVQPLWATPGFKNQNPAGTSGTNGRLAYAMWIARASQSLLLINQGYQGPRRIRFQSIYPYNPQYSYNFLNYFRRGFYFDSFSQVLPFNAAFIDQVLQDTFVYFARAPFMYGGRVIGNLGRSDVFINVAGNGGWFVYTSLHEMGHVLGLGESLSDLFAQEFMGLSYSVTENVPQNRSYVLMQHTGTTVPPLFRGTGGIYYNSTFDRTLLRKLESQGRANEFWYAAFYSNKKYGQLWDRYMQYISFTELQTVRAVYHALWGWMHEHERYINRVRLPREQFRAFTGQDYNIASIRLLTYWRFIMGERHPSNATINLDCDNLRANAMQQFSSLTAQFNYFAQANNIQPRAAVLDDAILAHNFRYRGDLRAGFYFHRNMILRGIVISNIMIVLHLLAAGYAFVWYKRPVIECKGFKQFVSVLYFDRPDNFASTWYAFPKRKSILSAMWCYVFAVVTPILLLVWGIIWLELLSPNINFLDRYYNWFFDAIYQTVIAGHYLGAIFGAVTVVLAIPTS